MRPQSENSHFRQGPLGVAYATLSTGARGFHILGGGPRDDCYLMAHRSRKTCGGKYLPTPNNKVDSSFQSLCSRLLLPSVLPRQHLSVASAPLLPAMAPHVKQGEIDWIRERVAAESPIALHTLFCKKRARAGKEGPTLGNFRYILKGKTYKSGLKDLRGRRRALSRQAVLKINKQRKQLQKKAATAAAGAMHELACSVV